MIWKNKEGFEYLDISEFLHNTDLNYSKDIQAGFVGKTCDATNPKNIIDFFGILGTSRVFSVQQIHSNRIHHFNEYSQDNLSKEDYPKVLSEADGILVTFTKKGYKQGVFIKTADCVPLIILSAKELVLVHAGWRGLAAGIIENALSILTSAPKLAFIGPCARFSYEVGWEVIVALKEDAHYSPSLASTNKYLLDMQSSTYNKILRLCGIKANTSDLCTITDSRFFSHRCQDLGRNLTFLLF